METFPVQRFLKKFDRKNVTDKNVGNITSRIMEELKKDKKLFVDNQKLK